MSKAKITTIPFGNLAIEGLLLPESTKEKPVFGVAVPQIATLFSLTKTHATRDIKAILGEASQLTKYTSEINNNAVNVLLLSDFEKLVLSIVSPMLLGVFNYALI